jgi:hypothetical protein
MKASWSSLLILSALLWTDLARADQVTDLPQHQQQSLGLDAGLDSAMVTELVFTRRLGPKLLGHDTQFVARLGLPVASVDLGDYALDLGARGSVLGRGDLRLQLQLGPTLRSTQNATFSGQAIGVSVMALPGYQSKRWGLMAELGYEKMLALHLEHSDLYREVAYSEARDGWYGSPAGTFRLGLLGGARLGSFELSGNAGITASEGLQPALPPFYATLGVAYSF